MNKKSVSLSLNAIRIFETLYSKNGELVEDSFRRVAVEYDKDDGMGEAAFNLLIDNIWRPNTPVWFNAGISKKIYSACFVGDLSDSMESIYNLVNVARKVFQAGSGIGIPIGSLRETDAPIFETEYGLEPEIPKGFASGPVTFLDLFDAVGHTTKSGGRSRRAAILSAMQIDHPDIIEFIRSKEKKHKLSNMNISVAVTDNFMECLNLRIPVDLISPAGVKKDSILPDVVWSEIIKMAWKTGDPGMIFIDNVNKYNPLKSIVKIVTSNPCLTADTIIETDKGDITIKELIQSDFQSYKIMSFCDEDNNYQFDTILDVKVTGFNAKVLRLVFDHDLHLDCTPNHRIFTKERSYQQASDLTEDDSLVSNKYGIIKLIETIELEEPTTVYDITTEKNHNFFANGVLVHNCGEQFLPPWGACNLSHINVAKFVTEDGYDFNTLFDTAKTVTRMMDNLLDIMEFPDERFKETAMKYRFLGLGMMGLADTFFMMDLRYNSKEARDLASEIMRTITHGSIRSSIELAEERGTFMEYDKVKDDIREIIKHLITPDNRTDIEVDKTLGMLDRSGIRHASHTCIAPTGTCAISCDASYGMEPSFGLAFTKNVMDGTTMVFTNSIFETKYKNESWYNQELLDKIISNKGSLKNLRGMPKEIRDVFVVAHDIKPKERIDMQSVLQRHCSNAISSTCNLSNDVTIEEISEIFRYAYEKKLKGITIYRDGCKDQQPVTFGEKKVMVEDIPEKMRRPNKLDAKSFCIELSQGTLFPIVSTYNNKAFEVFLQMGMSGQEVTGMVEWCGRLVSLALRHNIPVKDIVKQSIGIHAGEPNWFRFEEDDKRPTQFLGIPDAVGKLLERYYLVEDPSGIAGLICQKCGQKTVDMAEGCPVCRSCGFSKCS